MSCFFKSATALLSLAFADAVAAGAAGADAEDPLVRPSLISSTSLFLNRIDVIFLHAALEERPSSSGSISSALYEAFFFSFASISAQ